MIKGIEIIIGSGLFNTVEAIIYYKNNVCYLNNKKYEVDQTFLNRIEELPFPWKNEYGSTNDIDVEEFKINVITDEGINSYHGKGKYPNNYYQLKLLLEELNER